MDGDFSCSPVGRSTGKYLTLRNAYGPGKQQYYILFGAGKRCFRRVFADAIVPSTTATGTKKYTTYNTGRFENARVIQSSSRISIDHEGISNIVLTGDRIITFDSVHCVRHL